MSSNQENPIVYPQLDVILPSSSAPSAPSASDSASSSSIAGAEQWGAHTLGDPSKPQDHPHNLKAATWQTPISQGVERDESASSSAPGSHGHGTNPYIATSGSGGKSPMDIIAGYTGKWKQKVDEISKKAEEAAGNVWQHLKTGPSMADIAWGRLNQGTKLLAEGGFDKVFKQSFETIPGEELRKTYACYLSTSAGPVAGTLYISTKKIAFCSDLPLSYQTEAGRTDSAYYKVVLPLERLQAANSSANPSNAAEKYIEILTVDNHEFWFMGFINYDKALRNLQEAATH